MDQVLGVRGAVGLVKAQSGVNGGGSGHSGGSRKRKAQGSAGHWICGPKEARGIWGGGVIKPFGEENDSHFFPHLEMNHCSMTQAETLEPSDCVEKGVGGVIEAAENSGLRRAVGPASSQD